MSSHWANPVKTASACATHGSCQAPLAEAVAEVANQLGVDPHWLNSGPARLMDWGLPESRLTSISYGATLRVHIASRLDQICFKTYAAADVAGRHLTDLISLSHTRDEMDFAFSWTLQQDSSMGFRSQLEQLADYLEVSDVLDALEQ